MRPNVVLISIDALMPEFLFESERLGVHLPNLQKYFIEHGTYAGGGMKSVFPPFTYPCHQSIITGTNPIKHGMANNLLYDPEGIHKGAWNWRCTTKVKTLWGAAKENGYISASVSFPASAGAKGDYIAPEFWWDGTDFDNTLVDLMAVPQGLVLEMQEDIGGFANGYELTDESDVQRFKEMMWVLQHKLKGHLSEKPFFLTGYFASFDESAHQNGVYSKEAATSLEAIDKMVGTLVEEVHQLTEGNVVVCIVSDHGSIDNKYNISPNVLFRENGLVETDDCGNLISWKVWSQRAGGISEVRLHDSQDMETYQKVKALLEGLIEDKESGFLECLDHEASIARGGFPEADFVLVAEKGYEIRDNVTGPYCSTDVTQKAQHGYSEEFPEMRASFLIEGAGIGEGKDIGAIKLIDIAPTLAAIMGFELPDADGKNVLK